MAEGETGLIRVRRVEAGRDSRATYRVIVDGLPVASVSRGGTAEVAVAVGDHAVIVSGGKDYESEALDVRVGSGQAVSLRCMPKVTTVTTMIGLMRGKQPTSGIRLVVDDD